MGVATNQPDNLLQKSIRLFSRTICVLELLDHINTMAGAQRHNVNAAGLQPCAMLQRSTDGVRRAPLYPRRSPIATPVELHCSPVELQHSTNAPAKLHYNSAQLHSSPGGAPSQHLGCSGAPTMPLHCSAGESPLQHQAPRAGGEHYDAAPGAACACAALHHVVLPASAPLTDPLSATDSTSNADKLRISACMPTRLHRSTKGVDELLRQAPADRVAVLQRRRESRSAATPTSGRLPMRAT